MGVVLEWFNNIGTFITGILDLILSIFRGMADMAKLLLAVVPKLPSYFSWLPDSVLYILVATFGIAVCYKILGREG